MRNLVLLLLLSLHSCRMLYMTSDTKMAKISDYICSNTEVAEFAKNAWGITVVQLHIHDSTHPQLALTKFRYISRMQRGLDYSQNTMLSKRDSAENIMLQYMLKRAKDSLPQPIHLQLKNCKEGIQPTIGVLCDMYENIIVVSLSPLDQMEKALNKIPVFGVGYDMVFSFDEHGNINKVAAMKVTYN